MVARFLPVAAFILVMVTAACGAFDGVPTPRPTYTPYPTLTPAPTATPRPTYTPFPTQAASRTAPTTVTPAARSMIEFQGKELVFGLVLTEFEKGRAYYDAGEYQAAIDTFKQALELHGSPSSTMENWLGLSYEALGEYEAAIVHLSNAIDIERDALNLFNRAATYRDMNQCDAAIADAQGALALEPVVDPGWHSDAEANVVLADCYAMTGERLMALQHAEAAIRIAEGNGYSEAGLEGIKELKDWLGDG